jgi:hypothetical protein
MRRVSHVREDVFGGRSISMLSVIGAISSPSDPVRGMIPHLTYRCSEAECLWFRPPASSSRFLDPQVARELGVVTAHLRDEALGVLAADDPPRSGGARGLRRPPAPAQAVALPWHT